MTALAAGKMGREERWKQKQFTLAAGFIGYQNGAAFMNLSTGKVEPAQGKTGYLYLGVFINDVDATAADTIANIDLVREIVVRRFVNAAGGDAVLATNVGGVAFFADDQTVGITPAGRTLAGRVWDVDATKGVAIERFDADTPSLAQPAATSPAAYVANDLALTAVQHEAVYDVPATGAASTITLPVGAPDGTRVYFAADGTKNANTVQYRDATGPTNLTTALTAAKRHLVECVKNGGKWFANAYVSP